MCAAYINAHFFTHRITSHFNC